MPDTGIATNQFFEKAKSRAIKWIEIPAMAPYETKWSSKRSENAKKALN